MNYGFHDFVPLSDIEILSRISQEEIFSLIMQPVLGVFVLSPLRKGDTDAGCYFEWYNGKLYFIDFGFSNTPLDCFGFVGAYYGVGYGQTLKLVNEHFELGLGHSEHVLKPVIANYKSPEKISKNTQILVQPRNYTEEDGKYWSKFGIKHSQLVEDHVFAVRWYKVLKGGKQSVIRPRKPSYAYFEFKPRVKIYCPTTKNYSEKWITNCSKNDIGNIRNISPYGTNLLITKSYKDCRVLRNAGKQDVIWFQNEGTLPDMPIILSLCKRFQNISVLFDNDEAGIKALERVVPAFNSHYPDKARGFITPYYSDPAEVYYRMGQKVLIEFLKHNQIL